jgi:hypothetical protein
MELSCSKLWDAISFTFNLKCVHILRNKVKGCLTKRRDYRVYEMVELRIYKNDFKSTTIPQMKCLNYFKIVSIGRISNG